MLNFQFICKWLWVIICSAIVISMPGIAIAMRRQRYETHAVAWFVSGVFVMLALPITVREVAGHLDTYTRPAQQKRIIRILFMVPVYAIDSWLALRFKEVAIYIDTVRECFEAYVIYSFFEFLLCYMGDEVSACRALAAKSQHTPHLWPFNLFFAPWKMGEELVKRCKAGVHGYVVVRPVTTIIALFCEWGGVYGNGTLDSRRAYIYLAFLNNCSQLWALYCLVVFYQAAHEELRPMSPFAKFMCVKSVVFFSFWQSLGIAVLVKAKVISNRDSLSDNYEADVATGLQDFLICIEMFFAAVAHNYAFNASEYADLPGPRKSLLQRIREVFDHSDVTSDVYGRVNSASVRMVGTMRQVVITAIQIVPMSPNPSPLTSANNTPDCHKWSRLPSPASTGGLNLNQSSSSRLGASGTSSPSLLTLSRSNQGTVPEVQMSEIVPNGSREEVSTKIAVERGGSGEMLRDLG